LITIDCWLVLTMVADPTNHNAIGGQRIRRTPKARKRHRENLRNDAPIAKTVGHPHLSAHANTDKPEQPRRKPVVIDVMLQN
jgi:hypothetical protein